MANLKNKKLGLFAAGILTLGLAACNVGDQSGNEGNSRLGTSGTGNQMGTYGNNYYGAEGNRNRLDTSNNGQVNDGGIDNNVRIRFLLCYANISFFKRIGWLGCLNKY